MKKVTIIMSLLFAACADSGQKSQTYGLNSLGEDTPVYFVSPAAGFTSGGTQAVTVWVAKGYYEQSIQDPKGGPKGPGDVVLIASVDGCDAPVTASIKSDGSVAPEAVNPHGDAIKGYLWTVTLDLSSCQCQAGGTITHHCDGCGRTFDTCEDAGECAARAVSLVVDAYNQPSNNKCTLHDFNGDGTTDCDVVAGSLSAGEGGGETVELWVPPNFWTDDNTVCVARGGPHGGDCHPVGGQGGHSCDE